MLEKIFIKNYKDINNSEVRNKYAIVSGYFGIVTNIILSILKLIIGIISNSVSILADAINNFSDMITSLLTIIGFKISNKKPDKDHPYGHARYEYVFGVIISFLMLEFGLFFAYESVLKIINPEELVINIYTYIILVISILLKVLQMYVYSDYAKKINSKTLEASKLDTRNDIISTSVILITIIIMDIFNINLDGPLGLLVSLFVIYSSFDSLKDTINPLIGAKPSKKQVSEIRNKLLSYDYVIGIHDLMIHNYGVLNDYISVHIEIDSSISLVKAHDLIDKIENDFKDNMNTQLTIHIDPVIVGDKNLDKIKKDIIKELKNINKKISIHDFRIIQHKSDNLVLFDAVIPFDCNYDSKYLEKNLSKKFKNYNFNIEIDRPYC